MLEELNALLDAVSARILPEEGRVWSGIPVSRDTVRRIRGLVAEVDVHARPVEHRSLSGTCSWPANPSTGRFMGFSGSLANRSVSGPAYAGARRSWWPPVQTPLASVGRPARLALASALAKTPEVLVAREIDRGFDGRRGCELYAPCSNRSLIVSGSTVLASATTPAAASGFADRLAAIADGLLVFDACRPTSASAGAWRFGTA